MSNVDSRQAKRENLFLLARLRVGGREETHPVKVRNLSAGGLMAEGDVKVMRGELVSVELRNLGWVEGSVAWRQDSRFGIAFIEEIDPDKTCTPAGRAPVGVDGSRRHAAASTSAKMNMRGLHKF